MISTVERLEAQEQISRVIFAYCERLDAADFEGVASLFERGVWHVSDELALSGKEAVLQFLNDNVIVHGDALGTRHVVTNIVTDVSDDGATVKSRSYVHLLQVTEDLPLQLIYQGRYQDEFAKTDGEWHFADRRILTDGIGDMSHHLRNAQAAL